MHASNGFQKVGAVIATSPRAPSELQCPFLWTLKAPSATRHLGSFAAISKGDPMQSHCGLEVIGVKGTP